MKSVFVGGGVTQVHEENDKKNFFKNEVLR